MICPNCGQQIPDGSVFCPNCRMVLGGTPTGTYGGTGAAPSNTAPSSPTSAYDSLGSSYRTTQTVFEPGGALGGPKKKRPIGKIIGIVLAVIVVLFVLLAVIGTLGSGGGSTSGSEDTGGQAAKSEATLEEYFDEHPDELEELKTQEQGSWNSETATNVEVSVDGNNVREVVTSADGATWRSDFSDYDTDYDVKLIDELSEKSGVSGITLTFQIVDSGGDTIVQWTVDGDGEVTVDVENTATTGTSATSDTSTTQTDATAYQGYWIEATSNVTYVLCFVDHAAYLMSYANARTETHGTLASDGTLTFDNGTTLNAVVSTDANGVPQLVINGGDEVYGPAVGYRYDGSDGTWAFVCVARSGGSVVLSYDEGNGELTDRGTLSGENVTYLSGATGQLVENSDGTCSYSDSTGLSATMLRL